MDRLLRSEIRDAVQRAVTDTLLNCEERWLTGPELCKQFQMFTPRWLKTYGEILPRKRLTVNGHSSRWAYAQHQIAENIRNGVYDDLKTIDYMARV